MQRERNRMGCKFVFCFGMWSWIKPLNMTFPGSRKSPESMVIVKLELGKGHELTPAPLKPALCQL